MARSSFNEPAPSAPLRLPREPVPTWITVALLAILAILPVFVTDLVAARTELITPLRHGVMCGALILGGIVGFVCACLFATAIRPLVNERSELWPKVLRRQRLSTFLTTVWWTVPLFMMIGSHFAWRATELAIFRGTTAPITAGRYREQSYSRDGRYPYYVEIDPYHTGAPADVAMPGVDYRRLRSADRQGLAYGFCAKVMEQRVGTAVRIWKPRIDDRSPSRVVWCPYRVTGDPADWVSS